MKHFDVETKDCFHPTWKLGELGLWRDQAELPSRGESLLVWASRIHEDLQFRYYYQNNQKNGEN